MEAGGFATPVQNIRSVIAFVALVHAQNHRVPGSFPWSSVSWCAPPTGQVLPRLAVEPVTYT